MAFSDLTEKEFQIEGNENVFRIKRMNAIEACSIWSQYNTQTAENTEKFFKYLLSCVQVKIGSGWLPVYENKNGDVYYPAEVEENPLLVKALLDHIMNEFFFPIFTKSGV